MDSLELICRKPVPKREALTIQHFDTPKTPFEAAMQMQAAQMAKKSSVASNLSALSESDVQVRFPLTP